MLSLFNNTRNRIRISGTAGGPVWLHSIIALFLVAFIMITPAKLSAECDDCDDFSPVIALKSNLLYDAVLTPDLGVEAFFGHRWSVTAEGIWAWWSNHSRNRCWRIYGGRIEMRRWLGEQPRQRALTGHHIGIYCSLHTYDFEFGNKGWQSPHTICAGVSYGYSLKLASRLNLDFGLRIGYASGKCKEYRPICGEYVVTSVSDKRYFGLTGAEVSLVWFIVSKRPNNPNYQR